MIFVASALLKMETLEVFGEFILERNLTNVMCVTKPLVGFLACRTKRTREKSYKYN